MRKAADVGWLRGMGSFRSCGTGVNARGLLELERDAH